MKVLRWMAIDAAENSIMQTITIAVIAITAVAGMVTIPNIAQQNADRSLRADMNTLRNAEQFYYSDAGKFFTTADLDSLARSQLSTMKVTPSEGTRIAIVKGTGTRIGTYTIIGMTRSSPALVNKTTGAVVRAATTGTYMYLDSRCNTIWQGTRTYREIVAGQAQDPATAKTSKSVDKCASRPYLPATLALTDMKYYAPSLPPAPAGTKWQ